MARLDLANTLKAAVAPASTPAPAIARAEEDFTAEQPSETLPLPETERPAGSTALTDTASKEPDTTSSPTKPESPESNPTAAGEKRRRPTAKKNTDRPSVRAPLPVGDRPLKTAETAESGMSFYLPESISDRYLAFRLQTRRSRQVILFDAIEATIDDLPRLVKEALGEEDRPKRTIFERSGNVKTPVKVGDGEPKVIHRVRMTKTNRDVLTDLAEQFGAPSRTFLIVVALDAYLPTS